MDTGYREHARLSKELLGEYSLGEGIQKELDANSQRYPGVHRLVDHEPERLAYIAQKYGGFGCLEIAIHIALDWDWFPEWNQLAKAKRGKRSAKG